MITEEGAGLPDWVFAVVSSRFVGELIQFKSASGSESGYLALPVTGSGPGVVVIQEWWGLVDHIEDVCDRLAAAGFVALAPDLYRGEKTEEPDEAGKFAMALKIDEAARQMSGAVDEVATRSGSDRVGVIGFCMGGGLALVAAALRPDKVKAAAPFYGVIPWADAVPDYSRIEAAIQGHYAEHDHSASEETVRSLEATLLSLDKEAEFFIYPGTVHGFFNDTRPGQYDPSASAQAWDRVVAFLEENLS